MASSSQLERRVASLETEVVTLKRKLDELDRASPWWEQIAGTFENDPIYEKAMQLGRKYRQSLRPKTVIHRKKWSSSLLTDFTFRDAQALPPCGLTPTSGAEAIRGSTLPDR
jgi:hypothetical protein